MLTIKEYVTVKRAADMLGVCIMTLHRWDAQGKLKAKRHPINGYRLYKEEDIKKVLRQIV